MRASIGQSFLQCFFFFPFSRFPHPSHSFIPIPVSLTPHPSSPHQGHAACLPSLQFEPEQRMSPPTKGDHEAYPNL
jgi:hypothetical protein